VNFGIVLDEKMGDEVKITVIATGFQRSNLPSIERNGGVFDRDRFDSRQEPRAATIATPVSRFESEPEPDDVVAAIAEVEASMTDPEANTLTVTPEDTETDTRNDLDMPAFLRRERKLFQ
jgi:cell division protein FtsZ